MPFNFTGLEYIKAMLNLTKQQQLVICTVVLLLLLGWTVKAWRAAHPSRSAPVLVSE